MNTDERHAPQADAWAKWHEQRRQNGIAVEQVATLFELDAEIIFNMVGFGVLPVVASPDGKHFFFDRRDIVRFVEDARWFSAQLREMGATPEELRECWRRMRGRSTRKCDTSHRPLARSPS